MILRRMYRMATRFTHHNIDKTVEVEEIKDRRWLFPDTDFKVDLAEDGDDAQVRCSAQHLEDESR